MLKVEDLHVYHGDIHAVKGISLEIDNAEVVTCIGANGAGKSTLLKAIMGLVPVRSGKVWLDRQEITNRSTESTVRQGLNLVPEGRQVFTNLTVHDNLVIGGNARSRKSKGDLEEDFDLVYRLFLELARKKNQYAGTLSGGERQMLAIACGLMTRPRCLLLDEPSAGLSVRFTAVLSEITATLRQRGAAVLLVEQNSAIALNLATRGYIFQTGTVVAKGSIEALSKDELVQDVYLGKKRDDAEQDRELTSQ